MSFKSRIDSNGNYFEFSDIKNPFRILSPPKPIGLYAISKYRAEKELKDLCKNNSMEYIIIRCSLVYGPRVKGNFLKLIKLINFNIPLPLKSIKNNRSILYVGNLLYFILECINSPLARNKIFLLSDIHPLSTPLLIKSIGDSLDKKVRMLYFPKRFLKLFASIFNKKNQLDKLQESLVIDAEESYNLLKIKPYYTTLEGLKITANWFKNK